MSHVPSISPLRYSKVVFLTGAGISVASGLRPYRGDGGVWESEDVERVGTRAAMERDPALVWKTFVHLATAAKSALPNAAHLAITDFQKRAGEENWVCVLTQNVDGLHKKAGTKSVLEMHGSLAKMRCTGCELKPVVLEQVPQEAPSCGECGALMRYDVVLFDEPLKSKTGMGMWVAMEDCELFIAVGTSGLVSPAADLVDQANELGARTILVNLEHDDPRFQERYMGRAEELLPQLLGG